MKFAAIDNYGRIDGERSMNIAVGRRRLVINLIADQPGFDGHRFPSAQSATDKELATIEARRQARFDRDRWESNAALYGVGHPR